MGSVFYQKLEELISATEVGGKRDAADVLVDYGAPTTSIAVLDGGTITSHCITKGKDDTETLFQACSISKAVNALLVARLVDHGNLKLSDKICDHLPKDVVDLLTQDERTARLTRAVTIQQLMSHTSGLSVHGFPGYPDHSKIPSLFDVLKGKQNTNTMPVRMVTLPGYQFMYSGGGIEVLQCLIEHVMQRPYAELMEQYVFTPLNMSRSCYDLAAGEQNVGSAYYTGYTPCESEWHLLPEKAAGGLWTTPRDLLKAIRAVQESLLGVQPGSFIKTETAQSLLTSEKGSIALSWFVTPLGFGHGGSNMPGWRCMLIGYADLPWNTRSAPTNSARTKSEHVHDCNNAPDMCGIAVMTNSAQGDFVARKVMHAIAYLKGWPEPPPFFGDVDAWIPFAALPDTKIDERWKEWSDGPWPEGWQIAEDENGKPVAGMAHHLLVALKPAAIPPKHYRNNQKSIDLLLDGTWLMLRMGWDGEDRIIEVWNGSTSSSQTLRHD